MKSKLLLSAILLTGGVRAQPNPPNPPAPPRAFAFVMGGSFLGVGVREIDAERMKELKLKEERGVEITTVDEDSPAAKGGLQKGDTVLEYNGARVEGVDQFVRVVRETPAGRQVKIAIVRNGVPQTVICKVEERKGSGVFSREFSMPRLALPDLPRAVMFYSSGTLGVEAEQIEGGLAEYFGVKSGVLVRSVKSGTPAEKAGLKPGDVITKVGDEKVASPREVSDALRKRGESKTVAVTIMREKKESSLSVTFDEPAVRIPRGRTVVQEFRF